MKISIGENVAGRREDSKEERDGLKKGTVKRAEAVIYYGRLLCLSQTVKDFVPAVEKV